MNIIITVAYYLCLLFKLFKLVENDPNIKDSDREDIPPGWAVRYDTKTKRVYYVDHVNKKTQWQKPGTEVLSPVV